MAELSEEYDAWLTAVVTAATGAARAERLAHWSAAPAARDAHPREEHLIPLMVATGAAEDDPGFRTFSGEVLGVQISCFQFGR